MADIELIESLKDAADAVQDAHFRGWGKVTIAIAKAIVEIEELREKKDHGVCRDCYHWNRDETDHIIDDGVEYDMADCACIAARDSWNEIDHRTEEDFYCASFKEYRRVKND